MKKLLALLLAFTMLLTCGISTPLVAFAEDEVAISMVKENVGSRERKVYYPTELEKGTRTYPVIVWANGTGFNNLYVGFEKELAKLGYIVVSSDETMAADGKDQITNLDFILSKAKDSQSVFYKKVATSKVIAMGHSQGGRSAVNASAQDSRFKCTVSLAGSNYVEEAQKLSTPTLFITGTKDSAVASKKWVKPAYDACKGPAVYASLKGATHTTFSGSPEQYLLYADKWIKAWCNNDKTALASFKAGGELSKNIKWQDFTQKNFGTFKGKITLSTTKYTYDGNVKKPAVTVKNSSGKTVSSAYYDVTYPSGRKLVGKYTVKITFKGYFSGTATKTFTIVPKGTTISSLSAVSKGFTAKWKKQATQTTGYQIQIATNSGFTSGVKSYTVSSPTTVSKKITKLTGKKKYFVRIRTYKTVSGTKYYSSWSAKKYVTTK